MVMLSIENQAKKREFKKKFSALNYLTKERMLQVLERDSQFWKSFNGKLVINLAGQVVTIQKKRKILDRVKFQKETNT